MLLIVALTAIVLLGLDSLVIEPLYHNWTDRNERIGKLKKELADGRTLINQGPGYRDLWDRMRTNTLDKDDVSLAESDLLKSFDRWAKDGGLVVSGIHPQWKQTGEDFATLECRAEATGTINNLAKFLFNVEKSHSLHNGEKEHMGVRIDSIEVTARDPQGQQLSMNITVSGLQIGLTPQ